MEDKSEGIIIVSEKQDHPVVENSNHEIDEENGSILES